MRENDPKVSVFRYIGLIGQCGLSMILPVFLFVYGAVFLRERFDLGGGVVLAGVLIGVFAGCVAFWQTVRRMLYPKKGDKKEK